MMIFRRFLMIAALFLASVAQLSAQVKNTLYAINKNSNSLSIFDLSSPSTPVLVNGVNQANGFFDAPVDLVISRFEDVLYVLNNGNKTISVFNLANDNQDPVLVNVVSTPANPIAMAINLTRSALYIACNQSVGNNVISIYDISNPSNPVLENTLSFGTTRLADIAVDPLGQFLYVGTATPTDNLQIYSLSNRLFPTLSSSIQLTGVSFLNSITRNVLGNVIYGTDGATENLLAVVNITDPLFPSLITPFQSTGASSNPVDAKPGFSSPRALYVANQGNNQIYLFDVTNSTSVPISNSSVSSGGTGPTSIAVHPLQPYFYVANAGSPVISNLAVFKTTPPLSPVNIPASTTGTQGSGNIKLLASVHLSPLPPTDVRMAIKKNCCSSQKGAAVSLVWDASASLTVVEYRIYKNGQLYAQVPFTDQTFVDCRVSGHNQYQVSAIDNAGLESALVNAQFIQ